MSNFKKVIEARRKAARNAPPPQKPISEMSEEELDRALEQKHAEVRRLKEQELVSGREAVANASGATGGLNAFLASRRQARRRPWK